MSKEFLGNRERALEEAFFAQQDEALLRRLKDADAAKSKKDALTAASGITDDAVLDKLMALGVEGAAMAALSLAPLVLVAWADGDIDPKEREAVLSAAAEAGLEEGGAGHRVLDGWLAARPPPQMLAAWTDYIRAISPTLTEEGRRQLKTDLLGRARKVAESTGGMLGLGWTISPAEKEMLGRLEKAFSA